MFYEDLIKIQFQTITQTFSLWKGRITPENHTPIFIFILLKMELDNELVYSSNEKIIGIRNYVVESVKDGSSEQVIVTTSHQINVYGMKTKEKLYNWTINPSASDIFTHPAIFDSNSRYYYFIFMFY